MGGCCCSSRKPQLHGTPVYYYCPPDFEEDEFFTSDDSASTTLSRGFLVELNLDTSTPDTYRPPPAPIPYDVVLGRPQTHDSDSAGETISGFNFQTLSACLDLKELDCKAESGLFLASPRKYEVELLQSNVSIISGSEEEDVCPTCLEEYDALNPKLTTKCNHHFHLTCILEWMERSNTCPICDQEMIYEVNST